MRCECYSGPHRDGCTNDAFVTIRRRRRAGLLHCLVFGQRWVTEKLHVCDLCYFPGDTFEEE